MSTLADHCTAQLAALDSAHRTRTLRETARDGVQVVQNGAPYLSFSCNDYLGLSQHPRVVAAAQAALAKYGAGAGASRLVTGNHPLYAPLEAKLAAMKGAQGALVFGSGYLANLGIIPALVEEGDVIFADKLVHACMLDGAKLSGATLKRFRHNDIAHLAALLGEHRANHRRALILVDHVYSMDGDVAPLADIAALARTHDAWTLADDAHGLGLIPAAASVDLWMGTLSKSAGSYGGYVVAAQPVIDLLISCARSFVFSTGLPPSACASALAALEVMDAEPARGARAIALANHVATALNLPPTASAILPIILGDDAAALAASDALKARGILAVAIRPPTVPPGTARLRLTFSANHTDAHIDQLIAALHAEGIGAR